MKKNDQRCKYCKFAHINLKLNFMFSCRRFPPTTTNLYTRDGQGMNLHTNYPLVSPDDIGCAEFKLQIVV